MNATIEGLKGNVELGGWNSRTRMTMIDHQVEVMMKMITMTTIKGGNLQQNHENEKRLQMSILPILRRSSH